MTIKCLNSKTADNYQSIHGDCVQVVAQLPSESVGLSVYSPPFSNLFCYNDSIADMGNSANDEEFAQHYAFLVKELLRVTKPGRQSWVHCSDLPLMKWKDGEIGLKDLPGQIIRIHQEAGWLFYARRTVWKCPVVEMTRTHSLQLLYKQLQSDSCRSGGGMADYLLTFRKPTMHGDTTNYEPVGHKPDDFPLEQWQKWASPVWMDIKQTNTLNAAAAKEPEDERHVCPLQLDLIERCIILGSNPGDVVLSPFMGIGSEGFVALKQKRKFFGVELKEGYWRQACKNLDQSDRNADSLLDYLAPYERTPSMEKVFEKIKSDKIMQDDD